MTSEMACDLHRILSFGAAVRSFTDVRPELPAILLIPGGPGLTSDYLLPVIHKFSESHQIWGYEYPRRFSNQEESVTFERAVAASFSEALFIVKNNSSDLTILGHSAGAMLTLMSWFPRLETLQSLILVSGAPDGRWTQFAQNASKTFCSNEIVVNEELFRREPTPANFSKLFQAWWPYYFSRERESQARTYLAGLELVPEPFLHQGKLFRDEFKTRGVPDSLSVLLINGEFDSITPPQVFDQNPLLNRLETKRVIISNAGHFPWIENQRAVENALTGELQNC